MKKKKQSDAFDYLEMYIETIEEEFKKPEKERRQCICPIPVLARCIWELKQKRK